jgi:cell division protein FtsB
MDTIKAKLSRYFAKYLSQRKVGELGMRAVERNETHLLFPFQFSVSHSGLKTLKQFGTHAPHLLWCAFIS